MKMKERNEIIFGVLNQAVQNHWLMTQSIEMISSEEDLRENVCDINKLIAVLNFYAKKLNYRKMEKESITKWLKEYRDAIKKEAKMQ